MPSLAEILHRKQEEQKEREAAETARLAAEAAAEAKAEAKRAEQAKQMWAPYRAKARETRSLLDSSGLPQLMEEAKAIVEPYARREPWIAVEPFFDNAKGFLPRFFYEDLDEEEFVSDEQEFREHNKHFAGLKIGLQWTDSREKGASYEFSYFEVFFHQNGDVIIRKNAEVRLRDTSIKRDQWEQNPEAFKEPLIEALLSPYKEHRESQYGY